jgi:GDP-L-fucose synthase
MNKDSKIYIAGAKGLVGSAIVRNLKLKGYNNLVFTPHAEFDLTDQQTVKNFFKNEKPDIVFLAAAKVGGIVANNTYRAEFIYENLQIQNNIIHQAFLNRTEKLIFLGSSCIYPKNSPQPMSENYLLSSELEYTNEPYAIAKIAGIKMIESYNLQYGTDYLSVMPTNLFGFNDNFDLEKSHVLPALIRKMHLGKALFENDFDFVRKDLNRLPIENINGNSSKDDITELLKKYGISSDSVTLWGSGKPKREFLHADDLADACVFLAERIKFSDILKTAYGISDPHFPITDTEVRNTHINIGTGKDISIYDLANLIKNKIVNYKGDIIWDNSKPDGTYQKLLNVSKLNGFGWKEKIDFKKGIENVYKAYIK